MEKIKESFAKNFVPVFVFSMAMGVVSALLSALGILGSLINLIVVPPVYVGFYRFLFDRMEDRGSDVSSVFYFYGSGGTWFKAVIMYSIGALIIGAVLVGFVTLMITSIIASAVGSGSGFSTGGAFAGALLIVVVVLIAAIFFRLMPYLYAYNTVYEVGTALKTSFSLAARYIYIFLAIDIAFGIINTIVVLISLGITSMGALLEFIAMASETRNFSPSLGIVATVIGWVISAGSAWANFTAAHYIFEREDIRRENLGDMYDRY